MEKKKCTKCHSTRSKLETRRDLINNIIPNSYQCVEYWNGCRNRIIAKYGK